MSRPGSTGGVSRPGNTGGAVAVPGGNRTREVLRRLDLDVTRRLDGILHGDHQGLVPGHGSEPGEVRGYHAGDDVRRIDWNVTARSQSLHVRDTIADRELECWVIADRSASLDFGTAEMEKSDLALAAAATVGLLAARGGNRVGAVIGGDASGALTTVPPRPGRAHVMGILAHLARSAEGPVSTSTPGLGALVKHSSAVIKRRGVAAVVSDFLDDPETWTKELSRLSVRQQVLAIEVVDPRELELPAVGVLTLIDTETGATREINTSSRSLREQYATAAAGQRERIAESLRRAGADHLVLRTDRDWLSDVARHLGAAKRRRGAGGVRRRTVGGGVTR